MEKSARLPTSASQRHTSASGGGSSSGVGGLAVIPSTLVHAQSRRYRWQRTRRRAVPYLFMAPFLILFLIFFIGPILYALNLSLYLDRGVNHIFVGLDNYKRVLQDTQFTGSVLRMLNYGIVQVPIMLGLALIFALFIDSKILYGKAFFRLVFFAPYAVPGIVAALLWGYVYTPQFSPIIQLAHTLHWSEPNFLSQDALLWSIANIATWEWTGYNMIILFASLKSIPGDLYEAGRMDGCTAWQVIWHIKLPLVRPGLVLTCVFSIIGTLQLFNEPQILSTMTTVDDGFTPNLYAFNNAFNYSAFNYSATISFALAFVTFIFSYGFLRLVQRGQEV